MKKISQQKKTYPYSVVLKECLRYFNGDELAATTWINKYAVRDSNNELLEKNPDQMHLRMSKEFARIEKKYKNHGMNKKSLSAYGKTRMPLTEQKIYEFFKNFRYIVPQGSVMASLGNPEVIASYSNCVVLPEIFDSYAGILYTDQQLAQLFKRRCGAGIDISTLRPEGYPVSNAARTTSGAVSFMERYSNTTREVAQNGRRGALMITMDIAHPDIVKFVTIKQNLSKITGANISVRISDEFMKAVKNDSDFTLRWPVDSSKPVIKRTIKALELWKTIVQCAHHSAEPGIIFWDQQHTYSTSSLYPGFKNVSTNPCSEIAMQGGDSCRLIALNLFSFVNKPFSPEAKFDYPKFFETVYEAQRLMDDLVDLELEAIARIIRKTEQDREPVYIKQIELQTWKLLYETGKKGRRTGLGFTALADTLAALGHKFDSKKALIETEKIMKIKCEAEFESSIDLAIQRGKFRQFNPRTENKSGFVKMLKKELPGVYQRMMKFGRRNISISTVAPTGSLSILTQTSSGIEPVFMLSYKRRRKINTGNKNSKTDFTDSLGERWEEFSVHHPKFKTWMELSGEEDSSKSPYQGATASEIKWQRRIQLQAVVQKYVTHSISSTINLASETSISQVSGIYLEAWLSGLKGITVYREGARSGVLISDKEGPGSSVKISVPGQEPPARPQKLDAEIIRFRNAAEKWVAVVGLMDSKPYEIFTGREDDQFFVPEIVEKGWVVKVTGMKNKESRYDFVYIDQQGNTKIAEGLSRSFNPEYWNYAKLISGVLRHGMPLVQVIDLVENLKLYTDTINTWKSGVSRALKRYLKTGTIPADHVCPSCSDPDGLIFEEGCLKCKSCGYSVC